MFKPKTVKALPGYRLWLHYTDGVKGEVDLSHLAGKGVFAIWDDYARFEDVKIGSGSTICWSDDVDLCADALYLEITGKVPREVFPSPPPPEPPKGSKFGCMRGTAEQLGDIVSPLSKEAWG